MTAGSVELNDQLIETRTDSREWMTLGSGYVNRSVQLVALSSSSYQCYPATLLVGLYW